ncbi:serine acetyltransferase [Lacticaseibacillus parakribbianus]|uniref:serine acetyltransferase n=1 Tax=Lacticaseibacillus parakribbianus TaxID=2970927 RepID=UPI0021CAFBA0|nr:serine acetyltransferase [Lacticaseibacillus parakribbianus]
MRRTRTDALGYFVIGVYRTGNWLYYRFKLPVLRQLLLLVYKIVNLIFLKFAMGIDIPATVRIGPELVIYHPHGIVITPQAVIGARAILHHQVTIGNKGVGATGIPTIGDDVEIGTGAVIIGELTLGDGVRVGANAVVTQSFPNHAVVGGVPARRLR